MKTSEISMATLTPSVVDLMPRETISSLKTLVIMGDKPNEKTMQFWSKKAKVINGYGPTEATIGATLGQYNEGDLHTCIGRPMKNYCVYILDSEGNCLPPGMPGEIYISGPGVARGYLNNPEQTEKSFLMCPFAEGNSLHSRMYKTGDLAVWTHEGAINFLGRVDHQIKVRGIRIELSEIESLINRLEDIQQVSVIPFGEDHNKALVAYFSAGIPDYDVDLMKSYLSKHLHPSVVPSYFIQLDTFPLTVNGKIDTKKLPNPVVMEEDASDYVAPRDEQEQILAKIFCEVLGRDRVCIKANFFSMGGHSLTATQIGARIFEEIDIRCPAKIIFQNPTVEKLSVILDEMKLKALPHIVSNASVENASFLTFAQQRLWFLFQFDRDSTTYNLPVALNLKGLLDTNALRASIEMLVKRHDGLRTVFKTIDGMPAQICLEDSLIDYVVESISSEPIDLIILKEIQKPFDLDECPPFRIRLYKLSETEHVLLIVKHNIITDAWSEGIFLTELSQIYNTIIHNTTLSFDNVPLTLSQGANLQRQILSPDLKNQGLAFWKKSLESYEDSGFPTDYARSSFLKDQGKRYEFTFSQQAWSNLKKIGQKRESTPFMVLASLLNILIAKYNNQWDVTIGTATAGRNLTELENIIGFFVNTIPLRTKMDPNSNWLHVLDQLRENSLNAYQHEDVPFEEIVEHIGVQRTLDRSPIFQILMILQNANAGFTLDLEGVSCVQRQVQTGTAMYEMVWNFTDNNDYLSLSLDFNTELFSESSVVRFVNAFEVLMEMISANCEQPIAQIDIINEEEKARLLSYGKGANLLLDDTSIYGLFEDSRKKFPDNIAVRCGDITVTYEQLGKRIDSISQDLLSKDSVHPGGLRVGILLDRSVEMVAGILSVLKIGGTYIPLDPDFPKDRLEYMLRDGELGFVLTSEKVLEKYGKSDTGISMIDIMSLGNVFYEQKSHKGVKSDQSAYIIYTSGSTGNPKGVEISQQSLNNLIQDMKNRIPCSSSDRLISITTISFDIFGLELFVPLATGAELILCPTDISKNPVKLVNYINEQKPTIMQATPTMWTLIAKHIEKIPTILCGGEAMSPDLAKELLQISDTVLNVYGPTETTIWSTASLVKDPQSITIGKPISNTTCYILDDEGFLCPQGAIGELCIGGIGVAEGYWKREELTNTVFISSERNGLGETIYKTGDLAQWDENGNIIYKGRKDFQVKLRGNRIELGEIETALRSHESITDCVVNVAGNENDKYLVAYYITEDKTLSPESLRKYLEPKLPMIMLPSAFMKMESFPTTSNNKIDRKRLPKPDKDFANASIDREKPANDVEYQIMKIWEESLNIEGIGVTESFFMLGGNSLHIPLVVSKLNDEFRCAMTIRDFILNSTVREIAQFIKAKNNSLKLAS